MMIQRVFIALIWLLLAATALHAQERSLSPRLPLSEQNLEEWVRTFNGLKGEKPEADSNVNSALVNHLNILSGWIQTRDDIRKFRAWKDDDLIVRPLIPLAAARRSELRVPATLVLGNVVDNTNVCHVIAYLAGTPDLPEDGQFNLLQVVRQVADYPVRETADWIAKLLNLKEAQLKGQSNMESTQKLLDRIRMALPTAPQGSLAEIDAQKAAGCREAINAAFNSDPLSPQLIRQRLFSDERGDYAAKLALMHDQADVDGRTKIVDALIAAIIPQKQDPDRRYRVNFYIAVTFTQMAGGALTKPDQKTALLDLRNTAEYIDDPTFKANVDRAIAKQTGP